MNRSIYAGMQQRTFLSSDNYNYTLMTIKNAH